MLEVTKPNTEIHFDRCLTSPVTILGIPYGLFIMTLSMGLLGFISYRSFSIPFAGLIFYVLILVFYSRDRFFAPILKQYLCHARTYSPAGMHERVFRGEKWHSFLSWETAMESGNGFLVLKNSNGAYQTTSAIEKFYDNLSSPDQEVMRIKDVFNRCLIEMAEYGNLAIYIDFHQVPSMPPDINCIVSEANSNEILGMFFDDRKKTFNANTTYAKKIFLTFVFSPPDRKRSFWLNNFFINSDTPLPGPDNSHLEDFLALLVKFDSLLPDCQFTPLDKESTVQYLHRCATFSDRSDATLPQDCWADIPSLSLHKGLSPVIGQNQYLKAIGINDFPDVLSPGLWDEIGNLDFGFRYCACVELICVDRATSIVEKISTRLENTSVKFLSEVKAIIFSDVFADNIKDHEYSLHKQADSIVSGLRQNHYALCRFSGTFFILNSNENSAYKDCAIITNLLKRYGFDAKIETLNTLRAWLSAIPQSGPMKNPRSHLITSKSLTRLLPLNTPWQGCCNSKHSPLVYANAKN